MVLYLINMWLYSNTADGQVDKFLTVVAMMGGSAGILFSILLFDRKAFKENMMSRVFVVSIFVIQLVIFLMIKGQLYQSISFDFWTLFLKYKWLIFYLGLINITTFIVFAIDKSKAKKGEYRIRIVTLLSLAFVGGSIGATLAMYILHHKTKKDYFTVGIPLIMIMQVILAFYVLNLR